MAYLDSDFTYRKNKNGKNVNQEKWSWKGKRKPRQIQERKMITEMMVIIARMILENHIYQYDGNLYLKTSGGGPIGLKLTGMFARLVMKIFDRKYLAKLAKLDIKPLLYKRYVYDVNMGLKAQKKKRVKGDGDDKELDKKTAREMREIANAIMPRSVVMEEDYPSNYQSGKLPMLDLVMWIEGITILHEHYAKPMASRAVVMAKSAFPAATKKTRRGSPVDCRPSTDEAPPIHRFDN